MKKLLFLAAALSAACAASAQGYYTDAYNPDITRHTGRRWIDWTHLCEL